MKNKLTLFVFILASVSAFAQSPLKVDFNMGNTRPLSETHEPGYEPWVIENCKDTTKVFDGVTVKMANGAESSGAGLKSHWYKAGIQAPYYARLVSDGLTVNGGDDYAEVDMTISGLSAGTHTLLTFHNTVDSPLDKKYGAIDIYVNNKRVVEALMQTNRVLSTYDAATAYITFEAKEGEPVVISFRSNEDNPGNISWNFMINGFCLDVPNIVKQAKFPSPGDLDYHTDADNGNYTLRWTAAADAVKHEIYFGTDKDLVLNADKTSSCYKGSQSLTQTTFNVSDLYSMNTYYWRIDEVEEDGTVTAGDVWSFMPRHLAFPGAEGYGRFARGGRDGKVVYVTNLKDYDVEKEEAPIPGSLRYAVTVETGPRTILFAVSGIIPLKGRLTLSDSNVTIAGQTSPSKGICIKSAPFGFSGVTDGIMRFIRIRVGAGQTFDGSGLNGAEHCIFDHNSFSWSIDEVFSSRSAKNFTLQKTMLAEALNAAGHQNYPDGTEHGYAASVGGDIGSFHHNLLVHCYGRNWSLAGGLDGGGAYAGRLDIFNNVVYNWGSRATDGGAYEVNFVNNYYKKGAGTTQLTILKAQLEGAGTGSQSYYYSGNIMTEANGTYVYDGTDNTKGRTYVLSGGQVLDWEVWRDQPFFESGAKIETAADSYKSVLSDVGCTMPIFDDHDVRMISETLTGTYSCVGSRTGKKGFPDSQEDVGGWEDYPEVTIDLDEFDSDRDGLPNWWEEMFGLNPNSPEGDFSDANADDDRDGYTNLEEYLHWMATPHQDSSLGAPVDFELAPYTRGFEKSPVYKVVSVGEGASAKVEGGKLTVTPDADFGGIVYVDFMVTDAEGSSLTRTVAVKVGSRSTTGIDSDSKAEQRTISIYPNPATDNLYVSVSGNSSVNVQLMNVYGALIQTTTLAASVYEPCRLDVSSLSPGVYLLKVQQGDQYETIKFIKK